MRWWETVEEALLRLGGQATLRSIYDEVRQIRSSNRLSTPRSLEEVVRKELEYNSSDSSNWRQARDIFYSVEGIGRGRWGLRSHLDLSPRAIDLDVTEPTQKAPSFTLRVIRDTLMAKKIKALHQNRCQICGTSIPLPNGKQYSEAHHIIPLGRDHNGPDIPSNILVVCPNHHAMLDYGCLELHAEEIRQVDGHELSDKSVTYHNKNVFGRIRFANDSDTQS